MTTDEAFKIVSETANVSKSVYVLKRVKPSKQDLQNALKMMVTNGVNLITAREALWTVEKYFEKR